MSVLGLGGPGIVHILALTSPTVSIFGRPFAFCIASKGISHKFNGARLG